MSQDTNFNTIPADTKRTLRDVWQLFQSINNTIEADADIKELFNALNKSKDPGP